MGSGLIVDVFITSVSYKIKAAEPILPKSGAIVADKGYLGLKQMAKENGLHAMAIQLSNMKTQNKDYDRFLTKLRAPYESVFSKRDNLEQDTKAKKIIKVSNIWSQVSYDMSRALKLNI
ncbi:MAG: hypothetical protein LBF68_03715 [Christensenellaceae bacterium]|jgi:hypothetical protein|nr:hypothetical protein [Christensenellaceae bacterium]